MSAILRLVHTGAAPGVVVAWVAARQLGLITAEQLHKDAGHEVLRVSGQQLDQEPIYIAVVIARAYDRRRRDRG